MKLSVEKGILTVSAEHKEEKKGTKDRVHWSERSYGHCKCLNCVSAYRSKINFVCEPLYIGTRSIRLPEGIDSGKISAEQENGVLRVTLPKAEGSTAQHIEIK